MTTKNKGYFSASHIKRINDKIVFTPYLNDTIYCVESGTGLTPLINIKRKIPFSKELVESTGQDYFKLEAIRTNIRSIIYENFLIANDIVYFDLFGDGKGYSVFYSLKHNSLKVFNRIKINSLIHSKFDACDDEYLYSLRTTSTMDIDHWNIYMSKLDEGTRLMLNEARASDLSYLIKFESGNAFKK